MKIKQSKDGIRIATEPSSKHFLAAINQLSKKNKPFISIQILAIKPELRGWTVMEDKKNAKPLALSFPIKGDADRVCDFVNAAFAKGQRAKKP